MLTAIAKPFGWLLMFIYGLVQNYGLAVLIFALIVKVILLPFQMKSKRGTMKMARFQPRIKELEKKYEGNQQKYQQEVQKLYKEEGVSPTSGCLWSLIPFPILIALYQAIRMPITVMMNVGADAYEKIKELLGTMGFTTSMSAAYEEIAQSQFITKHFADFAGLSDKLSKLDYNFLGMNLGEVPQWQFWKFFSLEPEKIWPAVGIFLLPLISAALTFLTTRLTQKLNPQTVQEGQGSMKIMNLIMPLISIWIGFVMPAALCVYWIAGSVFGLFQEIWLTKRYNKILDKEEAESRAIREAKEAELAEKRAKTEALREANATERNPNTSKKKIQQNEKQQNKEKAAEWEKKDKPAEEGPAGAVGERKYARGRAYVADRYENAGAGEPAEEDSAPEEDTAPVTEDGEAPAEEPAEVMDAAEEAEEAEAGEEAEADEAEAEEEQEPAEEAEEAEADSDEADRD